MQIQYKCWDEGLFTNESELYFIDAISVHYKNGDNVVYSQEQLSLQLIGTLQNSSFIFMVVNYKAGKTSIVYSKKPV